MAKKIFESSVSVEEVEIKGRKYRLEKTIEFGIQTVHNIPAGKPRVKATYKLIDTVNNVEVCKVIYYSVNAGKEIEMEYYTNEEYQGKGIATLLSKLAVKDIYDKKVTEKSFEDEKVIYQPCENLFLSITNNNAPSLIVAKKLEFDINKDKNTGNFTANMTKTKYDELNLKESSIEEQGIINGEENENNSKIKISL